MMHMRCSAVGVHSEDGPRTTESATDSDSMNELTNIINNMNEIVEWMDE
jgi:hypothetical protein